jgi:hypothetical protein
MNKTHIIINSLFAILSLGIAGSIVTHDTGVDKAVVTALTTSPYDNGLVVDFRQGRHAHTHHERVMLNNVLKSVRGQQPRLQPRNEEDRQYIQAKPSARGHHPFDNYTLPVIS